MNKNLNRLLLGVLLILASCSTGDNKDLKAKKTKLEELKSKQSKLTDEITKLEADILKLDPTSKVEKPKLVSLTTIDTSSFTHYIDLQGKINAVNISYITPRNGAGGKVVALFVKNGDFVKKGQLLLQLDDVIAKQNLQAAQQNMAAVKTQLDLSADIYKRKKNLFDQGIGTEIDVITSKSTVDNIERQYKAMQAQVSVAQEQVNFASVRSDVEGIADNVNVRVGEFFQGVVPGQGIPQISIVNANNLKVVAQVPENYIGRVKVGTHVKLLLPDLNKKLDALVTVASNLINADSHSFYVEANIAADKDIKPNQVVLLSIQDYNTSKAITIPVNTLQTDEKGKFVLVAAKENNKLITRKKPVAIGSSYGDNVEIQSGLQRGDVLITDGYQGLYDGQPVTTDTK